MWPSGSSPGSRWGFSPPGEIGVVEVEPGQALAHARQNRSDMLNFDLQLLNAVMGALPRRSQVPASTPP